VTIARDRAAAARSAKPRETHALERLVFFSDAVFAIAITLLVIELPVPHLPRTATDAEFLNALARLVPNIVGYSIGFGVIGAFWAGHHRSFMLARHYDESLLVPNLILLGLVAFMPFVTALVSAHMGMRVPTTLYCVTMLAVSVANIWVVRRATSPPVVGEEIDARTIAATRARGWGVALGSATAVAISLVLPIFGQAGLMTIPLWMAVVRRLRGGNAVPR
jgi:uncharacterized membrane protein